MPRIAGFASLCAVLLLVGCARSASVTIAVPKEALQEKLDAKFPLRPKAEDAESPLALTISDPKILLVEGRDKIGLEVKLAAEIVQPRGTPRVPRIQRPRLPSGPPAGFPGPPGLPGPPGGAGPSGDDGGPAIPDPEAAAAATGDEGGPALKLTGSATMFTTITYDPEAKAIRLSDPKIEKLEIAELPPQFSKPLSLLAEQAVAAKFAAEPLPLDDKTLMDQTVKTFLKSAQVKNGEVLIDVGW